MSHPGKLTEPPQAYAFALLNGKTTLVLKPGQPKVIKARAGEHYRVVKIKAGEEHLLDNVIASRKGDDLQLSYADGIAITLENYYAVCKAAACEVTLPGRDAAPYQIDGDMAAVAALGDGLALAYAHGGRDALLELAQGATQQLLSGLPGNEITYIPTASHGTAAMLPSSMGSVEMLGILGGGLLLVAAGGGGGTAVPVTPVAHPIVVVTVIAGPMLAGNGLLVNLYQADGTTLLGSTKLSDSGSCIFDLGSYTGVLIAKVRDDDSGASINDYVDEASGQPRDLTASLMALGVASTGTTTLNINALTTVAALKAGAVYAGASTQAITSDAVVQTNDAVASAFGLDNLTGTSIVTTVDTSGKPNPAYTPESLTPGEKYGAVLAALSGVDAANNGKAQVTIDHLSANLAITGSSGALTSGMVEELIVGARSAASSTNTNTSLTAVVSSLTTKVSVAVGIDHIAGDDVINLGEQATTITGRTVAGANVSLSFGGLTRAATVNETSWSYTLTTAETNAMGQGGETISATATLSDGGTATATRSIAVDTLAPTLAITSNVSAVKADETATVTFSFSEDPGSTFAWDGSSGDVAVNGGTLGAISGTGLTRTATFTPTPSLASGSASITVASGAYANAAGNTGAAGTTPSISIDTLAPTLAITSNVAAVKAGETATVTFTFSEDPGSTFAWDGTAGDVVVAGGTLGAISGSGLTRTATFTPTASLDAGSSASITVASGLYTDAAGNTGGAGTTPSISM
ncbi:MAG: hypothetical protein K9K38_14395, partial [Rhodoferax sp.]|nr:hypothetical protein [Rhodoferax sp.]